VSATHEIPLTGGDVTPGVVRVGSTVRRTAGPHTPAVHLLLAHLQRRGFGGAPRPIGYDDQGREVLTFVDGDVPGRPIPPWAATDDALVGVGQLLRDYHDAVRGWMPPPGARWSAGVELPPGVPPVPGPPELVGHGDVTPDNVVFRSGAPAALIDFDQAAPMPGILDVVIAARHWVPFDHPEDRPVAFADVNPGARLRALCDAYGVGRPARERMLDLTSERFERIWHSMRLMAQADRSSPWARMWAEGAGDRIRRAAWWFDEQRPQLSRALAIGGR
jgi:hypothetical protein